VAKKVAWPRYLFLRMTNNWVNNNATYVHVPCDQMIHFHINNAYFIYNLEGLGVEILLYFMNIVCGYLQYFVFFGIHILTVLVYFYRLKKNLTTLVVCLYI
jgi:hypothetical protein